jgi:uncharacterized protein YjbI with pentapeptide repeats
MQGAHQWQQLRRDALRTDLHKVCSNACAGVTADFGGAVLASADLHDLDALDARWDGADLMASNALIGRA